MTNNLVACAPPRPNGEVDPRASDRDTAPALLTIITATFNAAATLERTIDSIREQTYAHIEWIVIDGNSSDGTVDLIREHQDIIAQWISEPDSGIYDAWNKGIRLSHGEFICFIGADDVFATNESVSKLMSEFTDPKIDVVCSKSELIDDSGRSVRLFGGPWNRSRMSKRQVVAHSGLIVRFRLFKEHGNFDISFKICGDYEWLLRLNSSVNASFLDCVSVRMGDGGVSTKKLRVVLMEVRKAQAMEATHSKWARDLRLLAYAARIHLSLALRSGRSGN